jgi:hypothetical protein
MTEDEIKAEIAEQVRLAKEAAKSLNERADYLRKVLDGPGVTPVLHYVRYGSHREEEHLRCDLVDAFRYLRALEDEGVASGDGVSVGGSMISLAQWYEDPRRPRDDDWD